VRLPASWRVGGTPCWTFPWILQGGPAANTTDGTRLQDRRQSMSGPTTPVCANGRQVDVHETLVSPSAPAPVSHLEIVQYEVVVGVHAAHRVRQRDDKLHRVLSVYLSNHLSHSTGDTPCYAHRTGPNTE